MARVLPRVHLEVLRAQVDLLKLVQRQLLDDADPHDLVHLQVDNPTYFDADLEGYQKPCHHDLRGSLYLSPQDCATGATW